MDKIAVLKLYYINLVSLYVAAAAGIGTVYELKLLVLGQRGIMFGLVAMPSS